MMTPTPLSLSPTSYGESKYMRKKFMDDDTNTLPLQPLLIGTQQVHKRKKQERENKKSPRQRPFHISQLPTSRSGEKKRAVQGM